MRLLRDGLRDVGISVTDPSEWNLKDTDFRQVCKANILNVVNSKLILAVATDPSVGLGAELMLAHMHHKTVITVVFKGEVNPAWAAFCTSGKRSWLQIPPDLSLEKAIKEIILLIKIDLRD